MNLILCCLRRRHVGMDYQRVLSITPGRPAAKTMLQQDLETTNVFSWVMLKLSVVMEYRPALYLGARAALDKSLACR